MRLPVQATITTRRAFAHDYETTNLYLKWGVLSMNCCCKSRETNDLKIEGDVGADPIWCNRCGCNLDMEDVPLSESLAKELSIWAMSYGRWIDWELDELLPGGTQLENQFNQEGLVLTEKVKQEIGGNYHMKFVPSISAGFYINNQNDKQG